MDALRYRFASVKDARLLARLNAQLIEEGADFGPTDLDALERRIRSWLADGNNRGVLFENAHGQVLAYAVYQESPQEIYLRQFLVLRSARRSGVGRQAFHLLRNRLWRADKRLTLEVMSANHTAYRFWRSLGYQDCALTLEIPAPQTGMESSKFPLPTPGLARAVTLFTAFVAAIVSLGCSALCLLRQLGARTMSVAQVAGRSAATLVLAALTSTPVAAASAVPHLVSPYLDIDITPRAAGQDSLRASRPHNSSARRHEQPAARVGISDIELRAMRSVGACPSSVYRIAWLEALRYRVEPAWVVAIIESESSCRPDAISKAGALGLMQLVPGTGARDAYRLVYGKDEAPAKTLLRDPQANIRLGVAYLRTLHDHFLQVGSEKTRILLAIAAYNCGTDLFDQQLPLASVGWNPADIENWIAQHAPRETRGYVTQVRVRAARYNSALVDARAVGQRAAVVPE